MYNYSDTEIIMKNPHSQHITTYLHMCYIWVHIKGNLENVASKCGWAFKSAVLFLYIFFLDRMKNDEIGKGNMYGEGRYVGDETTVRAFITGEHHHDLKANVSKYMCGFLNSSQKGTLYIGVEERGMYIYTFYFIKAYLI